MSYSSILKSTISQRWANAATSAAVVSAAEAAAPLFFSVNSEKRFFKE